MSGHGADDNGSSSGPHPLEPLLLDQVEPLERGRAHGEHWREAIHELAQIRVGLALRRGSFVDEAELLGVARRHLPVLRAELPAMADELQGIAEGADLSPERVVVLNREHGAGSTAIYLNGDEGPVLGETWDLHADAEPYVRMLRIAAVGGEQETLCLTLVGCLGVAGLGGRRGGRGVAVAINELSSTDGRVGVLGPAVVRAMLEQDSADKARALLLRTPLASGRNYMIADGHRYFGIETSGELKVQTQEGPRAAHLHTNHCFDPVLRQREAVARSSTTFHRLNLATTIYAQQRPRDADALWCLLHTHDGTPGSLCVEPSPAAEPTATTTCAVIVMRIGDGWMRVVRGSAHRAEPLELSVGRWGEPSETLPA
ncbi:MAG: C45 family peptidase [Nannocystaceae bacterium]